MFEEEYPFIKRNQVLNEQEIEQPVTLFYMNRKADESGISGPGSQKVIGAIFPSGKAVVQWQTNSPTIGIHNSIEDFKKAHMNPHAADANELIILDGSEEKAAPVNLKRFYLFRRENPKFKSISLGRIIEGVLFPNGQVVGEFKKPLSSMTVYPNVDSFKEVHVNMNTDTNSFVWVDFSKNSML